ncbi:unnamed protein product [Arctia plantaginis]|uniref:Probable deoxycytidylate deaminase n=1 Tax=Arctia plantaginis TaxID=874455 RepID=A0A8S0ZZK5_ARCPL|nr:unnamed protein product [Arctia plantaginis]CAB3238718.1 unnamed protein product [Arctia plantaginis]
MSLTEATANMSLQDDNTQTKRVDYISWQDYFMAVAVLAAKRSKDPKRQVGACIVNDEKRIVGIGYNGMPNGCSDDEFPWGSKKHHFVCHAEMNAIVNSNSVVKNCTIYVSLFPCNECAKIVIQSGIKKVIYLSDKKAYKDEYKASRKMLNAAKVELEQYKTNQNKIEIDFTIEGDMMSP